MTPRDVLTVWEAGRQRSAVERALLLAAAEAPDLSPAELAAMSIGERDRRLLDLREDSLGPLMEAMATCPACSTALDFQLPVSDLRVVAGDELAPEVDLDGWQLGFQLPNSNHLMAVAGEHDAVAVRKALVLASLASVTHQGRGVPYEEIPDEVVDAVSSRMSECDPQGELRMKLLCPVCEHAWLALFDIGSFLWAELGAIAHGLLWDVHALASAYGWREDDVLRIPAGRRRAYLDMVGT